MTAALRDGQAVIASHLLDATEIDDLVDLAFDVCEPDERLEFVEEHIEIRGDDGRLTGKAAQRMGIVRDRG